MIKHVGVVNGTGVVLHFYAIDKSNDDQLRAACGTAVNGQTELFTSSRLWFLHGVPRESRVNRTEETYARCVRCAHSVMLEEIVRSFDEIG